MMTGEVSGAGGVSPWWAAVLAPVLLFLGAVFKTYADLVRGKDDSQARWRREILEQNERQQGQIDRNDTKIQELEGRVSTEQNLRHELRNQLHAKEMELALLKQEHTHALEECKNQKIELEALRKAYEQLKLDHERTCARQGCIERGSTPTDGTTTSSSSTTVSISETEQTSQPQQQSN